jgi:outer membrane protein assembly factor BamB
MRALAALALAACTAEAAPASPSLKLLAEVPAWSVETVAGKVVVIDEDFLSISALDGATGKKAWTQKLQKEPARGTHTLLVDGGSVIAWYADRAHVVDGATGKRGASYDTISHANKCWLDVTEGVCARRCQCSFQLADCATGATKGASYQGAYMEEFDPDGGASAGCWGHGGWLHGKAGNVALISAEDASRGTSKAQAKTITAAIDLGTGKELWRRDIYASIQTYESGHSPDGKTCWFTGIMGDLQVLDCATGTALWTTKAPASRARGPHLVSFVPGKGLFEQVNDVATLHAERTGKAVWSVPMIGGAAWLTGTEPPTTAFGETTKLVLLDVATGKSVSSIDLPPGSLVRSDGAGALLVAAPKEIIAYDTSGVEKARASFAMPNLDVSASFVTARREKDILVLDRKTLREIAKLPGANGSVHLEGALGPGRLVAWFYGGKQAGKAKLYALLP